MSKTYYKDEKFLKKLGTHLRKVRKSKKVSQEDLGNTLGFSQSHIAGIEAGRVNTSVSHIHAIAKHLKVPTSSLFEF